MGEAPDPNTVIVDPREGGQKLLQFLATASGSAAVAAASLDPHGSGPHQWWPGKTVRPCGRGDSVRLPPFALGMSRRSKATGGQASPEQEHEPRQRTQALPPAPRPLQKDGDLWVFCKPAGLPTHPGTGHEDSLSSRLAARAGDAPFKPTPVHRLDKDTSGILLVAASFSVLRELTTALRERRMKKEYLAWVEGALAPYGGCACSGTGCARRPITAGNRCTSGRPAHRAMGRRKPCCWSGPYGWRIVAVCCWSVC